MKSGGYLGKNARAWRDDHVSRHGEIYERLRSILARCYALVPAETRAERPLRMIVLCTLYIRSLEHYQAAVLLSQSGLVAPAHASLRAMLESVFVLSACAENDDYVEEFVKQHDRRRLRLINKARALSKNDTTGLRERALEVPIAEVKEDAEGIADVSLETWSRRADMHDFYIAVYSTLSGSAHPVIKNLERYLVRGSSGELLGIDMRPCETGFRAVLGTGLECLAKIVAYYATELSLDISDEIAKWRSFAHELNSFDDERAV